jgi:hypothetical protein
VEICPLGKVGDGLVKGIDGDRWVLWGALGFLGGGARDLEIGQVSGGGNYALGGS